MHLLFPDEGLWTLITRYASPELHYRLFVNNLLPTLDTVLADLVEATFTGYAMVVVFPGSFAAGSILSHQASLIAPAIGFPNNDATPQSAYGYYITDETDTVLLGVALFDGAPLTKNPGDGFVVVPILGDFSKYAS
jgi:hypothetical protein